MPHCGASVGVVQGTSKHNRRHTAAKCCAETRDPRLRRDSSMVPTSYAPPDVFYVLPRCSPPKLVQARARPKWDGSEGLDVRSGTQSARSGHCTQCGSGLADPRLGGLGHLHSAGSVMRATCQRGARQARHACWADTGIAPSQRLSSQIRHIQCSMRRLLFLDLCALTSAVPGTTCGWIGHVTPDSGGRATDGGGAVQPLGSSRRSRDQCSSARGREFRAADIASASCGSTQKFLPPRDPARFLSAVTIWFRPLLSRHIHTVLVTIPLGCFFDPVWSRQNSDRRELFCSGRVTRCSTGFSCPLLTLDRHVWPHSQSFSLGQPLSPPLLSAVSRHHPISCTVCFSIRTMQS